MSEPARLPAAVRAGGDNQDATRTVPSQACLPVPAEGGHVPDGASSAPLNCGDSVPGLSVTCPQRCLRMTRGVS